MRIYCKLVLVYGRAKPAIINLGVKIVGIVLGII
jgi:hypothetical protein